MMVERSKRICPRCHSAVPGSVAECPKCGYVRKAGQPIQHVESARVRWAKSVGGVLGIQTDKGWLALALMLAGVVTSLVVALVAVGPMGVVGMLILVSVQLFVGIILNIAVAYVAAAILGTSFGLLTEALFKFGAIITTTTALQMLLLVLPLPGVVFIMLPLSGITAFALLLFLFELEFLDGIWYTIIANGCIFVARAFVALLFSAT